MPVINHWWTTRPKRKLITIVDVLRVFLAVAEGETWYGNRKLHLQLEEALEEANLKITGERRDRGGSGARTYAAWLLSFGLWFTDSEGIVRPTMAGEDLVKGMAPVPILKHQVLNFQYPSVFAERVNINSDFKIFPFRFILKLLLHPRLDGKLKKKEIGRYIATRAKTDRDLNEIVDLIVRHRNNPGDESQIGADFQERYGTLNKLDDVANTFINQLEYTQLIERTGGDDEEFTIPDSKKQEVEAIIADRSILITRVHGEHELFQRKYGLGPNHQRDNRAFGRGRTVTAYDSECSKVLLAFSRIIAFRPIKTITEDLLREISNDTGIGQQRVESIITTVGVMPSYNAFEEKFLQLSMGGNAFAREFEIATAGVFGKDGLGFYTEWIGSHPNSPDILAISEEEGSEYSGILDTKSYKDYTINGDHKRVMVHEYIRRFRNNERNNKQYSLAFFAYIAGGFGNTIDRGIRAIAEETNIKGSCITAQELIKLLKAQQERDISKEEIKRLFTLNRRLLPTDFDR